MPTARYFLIQDGDEWRIRYGEEEFGPYRTQQEAMVFAVDAAKALVARGESSEVCLMGENGHFHCEWLSHRDDQPVQHNSETAPEQISP